MNGYFRLVNEKDKTRIKLFPPTEDGKPVEINDVVEYLTMKDYACDLPSLKRAVSEAKEEETVVLLGYGARLVEKECFTLRVTPDKMQAYAKFYAPSEGGQLLAPEELLRGLNAQGIKAGICKDNLRSYFAKRNYLEEILVAEGTQPKQGQNACIEYFFNTDRRAKPTLLEDGSVDFFHLNMVSTCKKGGVLAKLHPAVPGEAGSNVYGEPIQPANVRETRFQYGKNIEQSEDGLTLISMVDGHAELVDDKVFVSDVLEVENVDTSTGNIDFEGSVQINGNVCTNFEVKTKGDIIVKGVVEGAHLEAGGNIIIVRGVNGMGKGVLKAGGNVISKFLENVTVHAAGYVSSESILHCHVMAGTEITVSGRRGFITGGKVSAAGLIDVKTLGSAMGADTVVEVGADPEIKARMAELQKAIAESTKTLQSIQPILVNAKQKIAKGVTLTPEQLKYVQSLIKANQQQTELVEKGTAELEELQKQLIRSEGRGIIVRGTIHPGTKLCIGDASMVVQKSAQYCRFIREREEIKMASI